MKKMYWRPQRMSLRVLILLAAVIAGGLVALETFRPLTKQPFYSERIRAARLTRKAFEVIREARTTRRIKLNPKIDPTRSGMIGKLISDTTTNTGHLAAKQTSVNPNFAAAIVEMLINAKVRKGDTVAVGVSGSFPALNIATYAALHAMGLKAVVISSVGASQFGANHPKLLWPDMEKALFDRGIFPYRSAAASLGGIDDRAVGLSERGHRLLQAGISRSGLTELAVENYDDGLKKRMQIYREKAGDAEIRAYINVGGGTISVGTHVGKDLFKPGLNLRMPRGKNIDSVMTRFAKVGVPVIHISKVSALAERYKFPPTPRTLPEIGQGAIYIRPGYSRLWAAALLALSLGLLVAFLRLDLGQRLFAATKSSSGSDSPQQMV
ncbi:MAG: poly-gamma-glutamate system protein [Deltaproteobacteria bacterium]|nr:poly-gamma-glutamate system protein [Deltaproteobacteria bacterium]